MTRRKTTLMTGLATALLLLSACSSGGIGDILGGGSNGNQNMTVRGVVDHVDASARMIYLTNVTNYNSNLANGGGGGGNSVRVYYDNNTEVSFQGRTYRPEDLERGDEVEIRTTESNRQLMADSITVTRDVSTMTSGSTYPGGSYPSTGGHGSTLRGVVRYVDVSRRTIELDRGYGGSPTIVEFDNRTTVTFNGRNHMPADLERGDEVDLRVSDMGNGRWLATEVMVVRSVSGGTGNGTWNNSNSQMATIRGTVRYVDTNRRTIELEQASAISGFMSGGTGSTVVVSYGANVGVEVDGRSGNAVGNLERGDVVDVMVDRSGGSSTYYANRIILVRDVRR